MSLTRLWLIGRPQTSRSSYVTWRRRTRTSKLFYNTHTCGYGSNFPSRAFAPASIRMPAFGGPPQFSTTATIRPEAPDSFLPVCDRTAWHDCEMDLLATSKVTFAQCRSLALNLSTLPYFATQMMELESSTIAMLCIPQDWLDPTFPSYFHGFHLPHLQTITFTSGDHCYWMEREWADQFFSNNGVRAIDLPNVKIFVIAMQSLDPFVALPLLKTFRCPKLEALTLADSFATGDSDEYLISKRPGEFMSTWGN